MGPQEDGPTIPDLKKKMYNEFVKKNLTPNFTAGPYKKLRANWDEFVSYKNLEEGETWVRRNQENARQKVYHHRLGTGGYKSVIAKWELMEEALVAKGITPHILDWPERSRTWFFVHGGSLDPEMGDCIIGETLRTAAKDFLML